MKALVRDLFEKVAGGEDDVQLVAADQKRSDETYDEDIWANLNQQSLDASREQYTAKHHTPSYEALPPSIHNVRKTGARPEDIIPFDDDDLKDF